MLLSNMGALADGNMGPLSAEAVLGRSTRLINSKRATTGKYNTLASTKQQIYLHIYSCNATSYKKD